MVWPGKLFPIRLFSLAVLLNPAVTIGQQLEILQYFGTGSRLQIGFDSTIHLNKSYMAY